MTRHAVSAIINSLRLTFVVHVLAHGKRASEADELRNSAGSAGAPFFLNLSFALGARRGKSSGARPLKRDHVTSRIAGQGVGIRSKPKVWRPQRNGRTTLSRQGKLTYAFTRLSWHEHEMLLSSP